jgi:hypothetical protein
VGLPRFLLRGAPIAMSSITTSSYYKLMFAPALCYTLRPVSLSWLSFMRLVKAEVNRDSARHSNLHKKYAAASPQLK